MIKGLFFHDNGEEKQLELPQNDIRIDEVVLNMKVGDSVCFPISKKGSVTGRVSDLNRKYEGERKWHTQTIKVEFTIAVYRDK